MEETKITKVIKEDSIKVTKGMNDKFGYEIKVYCDLKNLEEGINKIMGAKKALETKLYGGERQAYGI